jgi:transcriptional regulator with XRE-family HTH domain
VTDSLGQRLRTLRLEWGWSQAELGVVTGHASNRISDWENGRYEPGLPVLRHFAAAFETTVSELLDGII